MNIIDIHDKAQLLKFVCEDLRAISSVILTVGDHEEYANAYNTLKIIDRALSPIIRDIQEVIDSIDAALKQSPQ